MTPTIVNVTEKARSHLVGCNMLDHLFDAIQEPNNQRFVFVHPLVAYGFINQGVLTIKIEHVDDDIESAK